MIFIPFGLPLLLSRVAMIMPVSRLPVFTPFHGFIAGRLFQKVLPKRRELPPPVEEQPTVKISKRKMFFMKLGLKLLRVKKKNDKPVSIKITIT